jgi:hypothetical protein
VSVKGSIGSTRPIEMRIRQSSGTEPPGAERESINYLSCNDNEFIMYLATEIRNSITVEEAMHGRFRREWRQAYQSEFDSLCIEN